MKKYPLLFFLLLSVVISTYGQSQRLIIKTDFKQEEIRYRPMDGKQLPHYTLANAIQPDSEKQTEITLSQDRTVYNISLNKKSFQVYASNNSVDTVYLYGNSLSFAGDNQAYNRYLIQAEKSDTYCHEYNYFGRNHELSAVDFLSDFMARVEALRERDNQLLAELPLSEEFVEIQKYWTDLRYYALFLYKLTSLSVSSHAPEDWLQQFKQSNFPLKTEISRRSDWFYPILEHYTIIKKIELEGVNPELIDSPNTFFFESFCEAMEGGNLEYAFAYLIYKDIFQEDWSKDIPFLYEKFTALFPNSSYIDLLKPSVQKIVDLYNQKAGNDKITFINYNSEPTDFEEMMKPFLGKVVYIDVWATWCSPCLKSFTENGNIREKLSHYEDLEICYISVDKEHNQERWQKLISYHNLEGYHYRTNDRTSEIVHSSLGDAQGGLFIPRYVIVDKQGKIAFSDAASPSGMDELTEQLNSLLK